MEGSEFWSDTLRILFFSSSHTVIFCIYKGKKKCTSSSERFLEVIHQTSMTFWIYQASCSTGQVRETRLGETDTKGPRERQSQ